MDLKITLSRFEKYLESNNRSQFTIIAYRKDLEQLVHFLTKKKIKSWHEANTKVLEKYFTTLREELDLTPKSISRKINSTRTFYKFLISYKHIEENFAQNIKHPKVIKQVPRVLSPLEYKALRDTARSNIRLFTMIELLLQTGIRIGELSRIEKTDFDSDYEKLVIKAYSSFPSRIIDINPVLITSLFNYFSHPSITSTKSKYMFFTRTGNPILIRNIRSTINNAFKSTGIKDATVNDLRNTFIIFQLENGLKLDQLAEIVGHKQISTTEHYLEYIQSRPQKTTNRIIPL